jgi:two-component sensor histidine kinase
MKKLICFLFSFSSIPCFSQVDSIKQQLSSKSGKDKLELLDKLIILDTTSFYSTYYKDALVLAKQMPDSTELIKVQCAVGDHFQEIYEPEVALPFYKRGLALSRTYKLKEEEIICLEKAGAETEELSQYAEAIAFDTLAAFQSKRWGTQKELAIALEQLGIVYLDLRNYDTSMNYFNRELQIDDQLLDSTAISACLNNIGLIYYNRGEYTNSITNYRRSLEIKKLLHDANAVAQSQVNIGIAYKEQGTYDLALENLLQAARYFEKNKSSMELASCYTTIGNTQNELGYPEKGLTYHFNALKIWQQAGYKIGIASSLTNIGNTYKLCHKYDEATNYLNQSLKIKEDIGDKVLIASSLDLLGEVCFLQNDFTRAENYYDQSIRIKREMEDPKGTAITLNNLGELYLQWKKYDLALTNLDEARSLSTAIGAKTVLLNNYEITIKVMREKGDFTKALFYYDAYTTLKDSLLNEQKTKALTELQVKYETEKKEQQIILMEEQGKSQTAIVSKQHTLIYSLSVGTILLIVIVLISLQAYRSGVKANKQSKVIIEQKQMMIEQKQIVMKELHHRVKNNLQVLSSLLKLQQLRIEDDSTKEAIQAVQHRMNAMLLIHQDLYGESIDSQVNMNIYFQKLIDNLLFSFGYSKDNVKINLSIDTITLDADKALSIGFICNEVISNSFKHAFAKTKLPELNITLKMEKENLLFMLADNGKGMQIEKDIGKTKSFGLKLIDLFIKDLHGSITIASDEQGSRFEFIIPLQ